MNIFIIIGLFFALVLFVYFIYFLYGIHERNYINKLIAKNLNHLMEINYVGKFNDIRKNYDMFCSFAFYIEDNFLTEEDKNKDICISFKLKDTYLNKEKICLKYLKVCEKKSKIYHFLEETYDISVTFL